MNHELKAAFHVAGVPIPQGSKNAKCINGRAVMWEANPKLDQWRHTVYAAAIAYLIGKRQIPQPLAGAVTVDLVFVLPAPQKRVRDEPHVKPDLDKLTRAALDALTQAGAWADDSQVCALHVAKRYPTNGEGPGLHIQIYQRNLNRDSSRSNHIGLRP